MKKLILFSLFSVSGLSFQANADSSALGSWSCSATCDYTQVIGSGSKASDAYRGMLEQCQPGSLPKVYVQRIHKTGNVLIDASPMGVIASITNACLKD